MNTPLLRGLLNALAITLAFIGVVGLFWSPTWAWSIAAAAVVFIIAECIHYCSDRRGEQPPFTSRYGYVDHHPGVRR